MKCNTNIGDIDPEPLLVLVDEDDRIQGQKGKMAVHRDGDLHRAFSILIFNARGEMLIQQRAQEKYHSAGLWSNACCGHPDIDDQPIDAASIRLSYEMGIAVPLRLAGHCRYQAQTGETLRENEFVHIYVGQFDGEPTINVSEVQAWQWISIADLYHWRETEPEALTPWFIIYMDECKLLFEMVG